MSNGGISAEQLAKLRSELDVVQTNKEVFGEMLVMLQPGEENSQDFELLMVRKTLLKRKKNVVLIILRNCTKLVNKCTRESSN